MKSARLTTRSRIARVGMVSGAVLIAAVGVATAQTSPTKPAPTVSFQSVNDQARGESVSLVRGQVIAVGTSKMVGGVRLCDFSQSRVRVHIVVPKTLSGAEAVWSVTPDCRVVVKDLIVHSSPDVATNSTPLNGVTRKAVQR